MDSAGESESADKVTISPVQCSENSFGDSSDVGMDFEEESNSVDNVTITPVKSSANYIVNSSGDLEEAVEGPSPDITTMTPVWMDSDDEEELNSGAENLVSSHSDKQSKLHLLSRGFVNFSSDESEDSDSQDDDEMESNPVSEEGEGDDDDLESMITTEQEVGFRQITSNFIAGEMSITDFASSILQGMGHAQISEMFNQLPALNAQAERNAVATFLNSEYPPPVECNLDESPPGSSTVCVLKRVSTPEPSDTSEGYRTPPQSPLPPFNLLDLLSPRSKTKKKGSPRISDAKSKTILGSPMAGPISGSSESSRSPSTMIVETYVPPSSDAATEEMWDQLQSMPKNILMDDDGEFTDIAQMKRRFPRPGFYGTTADTLSVLVLSRRKRLPATFQNLIGEAHVQFARGNSKTAIEICMEIIKEEPMCSEPYSTLAMIYENAGDNKESLQFALIGALLNPKACQEWPRLADMCIEYGMTILALTCLTKAIIVEPTNPDLHLKRCSLLENKGDIKAALRGYSKMMLAFPDRWELCVQVLRRSAKVYHTNGNEAKAFECLRSAMENYPTCITVTETNLMLELCVSMKKYVEAAKVLIAHSNVQFDPELGKECFESREKLSRELKSGVYECKPPVLNADLEAKLIIVLVHLEAYDMAKKLCYKMISSRDVDVYGDLFLEMAESFMAKRRYEFPLKLLQPLVDSENFCQAAVWLRYAECLFMLGRYEEAAVAYKQVVTLAPSHNLAKLNLSIILQKLGRSKDALETLKQDKNEDIIDHELLMEKCHILYRRREYQEFMESVMQLLCRFSGNLRTREEAMMIVMVTNFGKRLAAVEVERAARDTPLEDENQPRFIKKDVNVEREWKLYLKLCRLLNTMQRWDLLARVTFTACASKLFSKYKGMEREAEAHCFYASLMCSDEELLPQHVRVFVSRFPTHPQVINLFGMSLKLCDHSRFNKHILRVLQRFPDDYRLILINAHISFATGTYKNALVEYTTLYSRMPEDPIVPLMMACTLLHMTSQKATAGRKRMAVGIVGFMNRYMELRGVCQESLYNMGRLFHIMGLFGQALEYYERVLKTPPVPPVRPIPGQVGVGDQKGALDLSFEAAYNMANVYEEIGCPELARDTLWKHIRI